jgi:recombination protein RecR
MKPTIFEYLIDALKSLPGIGNKQAERIAYYIIKKDKQYINQLLNSISEANNKIKFCQKCNNFATAELCNICANPSRNQKQLCIVSSIEDLLKIETTNTYGGLYYVLDGEVDVKTKTNIDQANIKKFMTLIKDNDFQDITIATN